MPTYAAVDLGATSGRVVNVRFSADDISLHEVARFPNVAVQGASGTMFWDINQLLASVRAGLTAAAAAAPLRSVAVDSWAIDYGLLDTHNNRVGPVHAYRSARTNGVMDAICKALGRERIYAATGIQFLAFNTAYQLVTSMPTNDYIAAQRFLMIPDLINAELCGSNTNEVTNASSTQLLNAATHQWDDGLIADMGLRRSLFPSLHQPGTRLGQIDGVGAPVDGVPMVAAASHDTASAVAGTPLRADRPGIYISCGTWSLIGCELPAPVTTPTALAANVTNELGLEGRTRLLKNVTGLWLLEECRRNWADGGIISDISVLVAQASLLEGGASIIDPDDPAFAAPGDMPARIAAACAHSGQPIPRSTAEFTRVILDSLALAYRRAVATIEEIAGFRADVVHMVGGGAANPLLTALCASACERAVLVGPLEATVVGNALVQAIADGVITDLDAGRARIERAFPPHRIEPTKMLNWNALQNR